jgi:hypothetical protein
MIEAISVLADLATIAGLVLAIYEIVRRKG